MIALLMALQVVQLQPGQGLPPMGYQGDNVTIMVYTTPDGVNELCGEAPAPYRTMACVKRQKADDGSVVPVTVMPNPCASEWMGDRYAYIACHELGHVNGWKHPEVK